MFFINILLLLHNVSFKLINSINSKLTISLYLDEKYDDSSLEVRDLENDIKENLPNITYTYKTKETVLKELEKKDPELVKILERINPLPETITLSNIDLDQYDMLNTIIENKLFIISNAWEEKKDHFSHYSAQYQKIKQVIWVLKTLQIWLYIIIWIFLVSIAVIIYSIIWNFIYYFKHEISITRLVWWSKLFIYWPFSLQGAIYSIISFTISVLIFLVLLKNLELLFTSLYSTESLFSGLYVIFILELFIFAWVGWLSWFLSSRKYLK